MNLREIFGFINFGVVIHSALDKRRWIDGHEAIMLGIWHKMEILENEIQQLVQVEIILQVHRIHKVILFHRLVVDIVEGVEVVHGSNEL